MIKFKTTNLWLPTCFLYLARYQLLNGHFSYRLHCFYIALGKWGTGPTAGPEAPGRTTATVPSKAPAGEGKSPGLVSELYPVSSVYFCNVRSLFTSGLSSPHLCCLVSLSHPFPLCSFPAVSSTCLTAVFGMFVIPRPTLPWDHINLLEC